MSLSVGKPFSQIDQALSSSNGRNLEKPPLFGPAGHWQIRKNALWSMGFRRIKSLQISKIENKWVSSERKIVKKTGNHERYRCPSKQKNWDFLEKHPISVRVNIETEEIHEWEGKLGHDFFLRIKDSLAIWEDKIESIIRKEHKQKNWGCS